MTSGVGALEHSHLLRQRATVFVITADHIAAHPAKNPGSCRASAQGPSCWPSAEHGRLQA